MKKIIAFTCLVALSFTSCAKKEPHQEYAGIDGDTVNGSPLPQRQEGVSFLSNNVERGQFAPVLFGFDSFEIAPSETAKLRQISDFAKQSRKNLILAGFTDERGTPEYNRGLGERRAQSARSYLLSLGVSTSQIQTVSFGQEMPVATGHDDASWARNRRVETGVVR